MMQLPRPHDLAAAGRLTAHAILGIVPILTAACNNDLAARSLELDAQSAPQSSAANPQLPDDEWTWLWVDGAGCRDGSPAGISIRPRATSDDLLIVLGGGPVCVDAQSCSESGAPLSAKDIEEPEERDIFADRPENPFRDWNQVWVPHCTDDYHAGAARDVMVPGVKGVQQFVGYANMTLFLNLIRSQFPELTRVVLGGFSSGGQGVIANFPQARRSFGEETQITLLIDSGPPVPTSETRGILHAMLDLWGADETLVSECRDACDDPRTFFFDYFAWLADTYSGGLDIVMTTFANDPVEAAEFGISEKQWMAYVESVDARIGPKVQFYHFYANATGHAVLRSGMYTPRIAGQSVADWLDDVLASESMRVRSAH